MIRKLGFILPIIGALLALGAATVYAQTATGTQNVSFTAVATIGITSTADVAFGSLTTTTTKTGSFTLNSNDPNGFSLTTQPSGSNYAAGKIGESVIPAQTCSAAQTFPVGNVTVTPHAVTGMTTGTGGTAAAPFALTGSPQALFSVNPTGQGTTMAMNADYTVNVSGIPFNTAGCQYLWTMTYTMSAL